MSYTPNYFVPPLLSLHRTRYLSRGEISSREIHVNEIVSKNGGDPKRSHKSILNRRRSLREREPRSSRSQPNSRGNFLRICLVIVGNNLPNFRCSLRFALRLMDPNECIANAFRDTSSVENRPPPDAFSIGLSVI